VSVLRIDTVTLLRRDAVEVTAEGFRIYDALFARSGPQSYPDGKGGIIVEHRPDGEVFSDPSLASYDLRPLADLHPPVNLDGENARFYARGATSAGRKHTDGRHVAGRLSVWDAELIDKFDAAAAEGRDMELSAGYMLDIDPTPGVTASGERYDAIQRNIRINHVAAVLAGRAGTARVVTDAADAWDFADPKLLANIASKRQRRVYVDQGRWSRHDSADLRRQHTKTKDTKMKFQIDGKDVELDVPDKATPQQIADAVTKHGAAEAKKAQDAAIKLAVDEALAKVKPKLDEKPKVDATQAAKIKELEATQAANADRADALSVARVVLGLGYTAADTKNMKLDTIEKVLGKDERDAVAKDPGALGYVFARAAKKFEADSRVDHGAVLLTEIQASRAKNAQDGAPKDTTQADRKAASDRAGMTRAQRKTHDAKKAS